MRCACWSRGRRPRELRHLAARSCWLLKRHSLQQLRKIVQIETMVQLGRFLLLMMSLRAHCDNLLLQMSLKMQFTITVHLLHHRKSRRHLPESFLRSPAPTTAPRCQPWPSTCVAEAGRTLSQREARAAAAKKSGMQHLRRQPHERRGCLHPQLRCSLIALQLSGVRKLATERERKRKREGNERVEWTAPCFSNDAMSLGSRARGCKRALRPSVIARTLQPFDRKQL